jgi:hypothetical protein
MSDAPGAETEVDFGEASLWVVGVLTPDTTW